MSDPTLEDLMAQKAALDRQIAAAQLAPAEDALAILQRPDIAQAADDLALILPTLTGDVRQRVQEFVTVTQAAPMLVTQLRDQLAAAAAEPAPAE